MRNPLVSIVIPSLNQGTFISRTLESILSQDYPNIEIIVMDGGSKDITVLILKEFEKRVKTLEFGKNKKFYWVSRKDKGQASAINMGLKKAKGEILAYLNSDDMYKPHAIRSVVAYFSLNPRLMWLTGDYQIVDHKDRVIQKPITLYKKLLRTLPVTIVLPITNPIIQPSTFWKRIALSEIGFFDESLRYVFDYEYWLRLSGKYRAMFVSDVLSSFRIHKSSKGGSSFAGQFTEEMNVVRRYVKNPFMIFLHELHNKLIVGVYNVIKRYG